LEFGISHLEFSLFMLVLQHQTKNFKPKTKK
jgi:hypothetical protein